MFHRDPRHLYRSSELDALDWLDHGFGTRRADVPSLLPALATLRQVHSAACVAADGRSGVLGEGDALLENVPGAAVAVKTADCVPILLADPRRRAAAAVHAGWRGAAEGIVRAAVEEMRRRFGSQSADLRAAIGPAIGPCCYEVGAEVAARFGRQGRVRLDLAEENRRQLEAAGVARIDVAGLCTRCGQEFHSFRRDGERAGRMFSFVALRRPV